MENKIDYLKKVESAEKIKELPTYREVDFLLAELNVANENGDQKAVSRLNSEISEYQNNPDTVGIYDVVKKFHQPIEGVVIKSDKQFSLEGKDITINCSYSPFSDSMAKRIEKIKEFLSRDISDEELKDRINNFKQQSLMIDSLEIKNGKETLRPLELLPDDCNILIFRKLATRRFIAMYSDPLNSIILTEEFQTPRSIFGLLHEIGHMVELSSLSDTERRREVVLIHNYKNISGLLEYLHDEAVAPKQILKIMRENNVDKEMLETIMRQERNANSFALKKIKPFIHNLGIDDESLKDYIHGLFLSSYSKSITDIAQVINSKP